MLMSAVVEGEVPANRRFFDHLDQCLTCRACEKVCPNDVAYGQLVNQVRAAMEPARQRGMLARFMRWMVLENIVASQSGLLWAARLLRVWLGVGGRSLSRLAEDLPPIPARVVWQPSYPAEGELRGRVALFLGCVASVLDVETLGATVFVLNRLGFTVDVPSGQGCCGALHAGQGELQKARTLAHQNLTAFSGEQWSAVIVTASGCGAALSEYPQTIGVDAEVFSRGLAEIGEFLSRAEIWREVEIQPLRAKIAVHEPCSLRNVLHGQAALYHLLHRIPGVELVELEGNDQCCGAGGAYRLTQPEMSGLLLADKVAAMMASSPQIVASSNVGCALHLTEGARRAGLEIEVLHPITLLARQMGYKT